MARNMTRTVHLASVTHEGMQIDVRVRWDGEWQEYVAQVKLPASTMWVGGYSTESKEDAIATVRKMGIGYAVQQKVHPKVQSL